MTQEERFASMLSLLIDGYHRLWMDEASDVSSVYFCVWYALEPRLPYALGLSRGYSKYCVPIVENGVYVYLGFRVWFL